MRIKIDVIVGCIILCFTSCCTNSSYDTDKSNLMITAPIYFYPKIDTNVSVRGESSKGLPFGKWYYSENNQDSFSLVWEPTKIDRLELVLTNGFELGKTEKNKYYRFNKDSAHIEIYLNENLSDIDTTSKYLLDELVGLFQICLEKESCAYVEKIGNLFTFLDSHLITFIATEKHPQKNVTHIGLLIRKGNRLYYVSYRKKNVRKENYLKEMETFTTIINNIRIDNSRIVPPIQNLIKTDTIKWN